MQKKGSNPQQSKAKITYTTNDLSAYLMTNIIKALGLSIQIKKQGGNQEVQSKIPFQFKPVDITNVKLTLHDGSTTIFGEIPIADFLIGEKNRDSKWQLQRIGNNLSYDHWAYYLNTHFRQLTNNIEELRAVIQELEERLVPELKKGTFGEFSILHGMIYSYGEPIKD